MLKDQGENKSHTDGLVSFSKSMGFLHFSLPFAFFFKKDAVHNILQALPALFSLLGNDYSLPFPLFGEKCNWHAGCYN